MGVLSDVQGPADPCRVRLLRACRRLLVAAVAVLMVCCWAAPVWADGATLFSQHCAGCHVNGGNIIRRGRTLKMAALERQGLASQEAIAAIAASGVGQMSGYRDQLGDEGVTAVATWVWEQAQLGWPKAG